MRNLMPIGRFARSCRIGVKALRHYDELGLLSPAFVDPQSGYRYYTREQVRDAVMIGMLRRLDLPLAVIRRALAADPGELKSLVEGEAARVAGELAVRRRALLSLRQIARVGSLAPYPIEVREHPAWTVARIRGTTDTERLIPDTTELVYALLAELREVGAGVREPVLCINEFSETSERIEVHACSGFTIPAPRLRRAEIAQLPGGAFASLVHEGPYETLALAHHALFAWVQERGHESAGAIWEFYRNDPADVAPEALVTEVAVPLVEERGSDRAQ
jgi:DNA-binding transcriptional MerR regulator